MERRRLTQEELDALDFSICGSDYVTRHQISYDNIEVPQGYIFDGVTVRAPFTFIFSPRDLNRGIRASCFHDWMCQHKSEYERKYSTDVLVRLWLNAGLSPFKASLVKFFVNLYQIIKGGWKC